MLQNMVGFSILAVSIFAAYYLYRQNTEFLQQRAALGENMSHMYTMRYPRLERAFSLGTLGFIFTNVAVFIIVALIFDIRWSFEAFRAPYRFLFGWLL
jgi:hypothetical protein